MTALALRTRSWLRQRYGLVLVTGLVIGLTSGLAMGLIAGTRRTGSAPDRYTSWAGGDPDLEVVQLGGDPLVAAVSSIPGVASVTGNAFVASFLRGPDGTTVFEPNPFAGNDRASGARVVTGRFTNPNEPNEFTVNRALARLLERRFESHVGDSFEVESFDKEQLRTNRAFGSGEPPAAPVFTAKWVGIVESPADFDQDTPALYYPLGLLQAHPTVGVVQTIMQLHLDAGADATAVLSAIQALPGGANAYTNNARIVSAESRRAVRFQATALWIVAAIVLLGAMLLLVQLVGRSVKQPEDDARALVAIGFRGRDLAFERALRALACVAVAVPVAVVIAAVTTNPFPLGALRAFEPHPGIRLDWGVLLAGILLVVALALVGALFAGGRDRDRARRARRRAAALAPLTQGGVSLEVGAHFARVGPSGTRRSAVALAAGIMGMTGLVAANIVALSLDSIVHTPARRGVNYDRLFGNPYVEADTDIVTPVLEEPGVAKLSGVHIGSLTIDGHETPTFAVDAVKGELYPTTLAGRAPRRGDEIGLGEEVAHRLHVGIGDRVSVAGADGSERRARVVGIVVTPDAAGGGASVTFETYRALNPDTTRNVLIAQFSPDASKAMIDRVSTANFTPPDAVPIPASIQALRRVLPAPLILELVLGLLLVIGCAFLLTLSTRAQRRDVAVLRAIGARPRQLRAIVHWQVTLVAGAILVVGLPLGIAVGRAIVRRLTETLGIVPGVDVSVVLLVAGVGIAIGIVNLLAIIPARRAARPATALLDRVDGSVQ